MSTYTAPVAEMRFVIDELTDYSAIAALPPFGDATPELVEQILDEAGKFGAEVLAPLNAVGDREGSVLENGAVRTPTGFKEAYKAFTEAGWIGLPFEPEYGGQGLPWLLGTAVSEIWDSANMAFALCPLLSKGATELLLAHGSAEQKATYLPKMLSGVWNGTMNLTEPQAGSDLAAVRTKAVRADHPKWGQCYRISGQKIFITYGENDLTENIVHLVLARLPDAPPGIKGISLFVVPKFMVNADGTMGERNDVRCVSLEHKLGIHASPTAVMSFGDHDGAIGFVVGGENRGIECMFTMMNNARLAVGLEGVAVAERAYQKAVAYARERVQGKAIGAAKAGTIIEHPDVRRMLLSMRAQTEAARALSYFVAGNIDLARHHPDPQVRHDKTTLVALLTPIAKAWSSDIGIAVADLGIQVHGGMGFIEETGAAQFLRDARITAIYEGTNGIQANDLVGRKVARDQGRAMAAFIAHMRGFDATLAQTKGENAAAIRGHLTRGLDALAKATDWLLAADAEDPRRVAAGSVHYLRLAGIVIGGWQMARAAVAAEARRAAGQGSAEFLDAKVLTARFFAEQYLPLANGLLAVFTGGSPSILAFPETMF